VRHTIFVLVAFFMVSAQTPPRATRFEIASIKRSKPGSDDSSDRWTQGRFTAINESLRKYIALAYNLKPDRVIGGPKWVDSDRYDIAAKLEGGDGSAVQGRNEIDAELRAALQALLEERFQLAIHTETKMVPGHLLLVGKNGSKLKETETAGRGSRVDGSRGRLEAKRVSVERLASVLSRQLGEPVTDQTGLKNLYDFTLEWTPDDQSAAVPTNPVGPSIFTALAEQLGLRLEAHKTAVEVIIIDHAERPAEN
jgi:uncharacterized protein (TIGR03435 family)